MQLRSAFVTLLSTLLPANLVRSALVGDFADLPPNTSYDFIVVGGTSFLYYLLPHTDLDSGGTAGSVVASRLSEDPKVKVLVLEAGTT
jgi:hypothetical protein